MSFNSILMPKLGLTMTEGLIAEWRVKAGDAVKVGDVMFIVETDKIATDVEARAAGTIERIEVAQGETVAVGASVAVWTGPAQGPELLSDDGESANEAPAEAISLQPAQAPALAMPPPKSDTEAKRLVATPLAKRLAREENVDLTGVRGSGPRGRIKAQDVRNTIPQDAAPELAPERSAPAPAAPSTIQSQVAGNRRSATAFESTVARRLTEAKQQIPHFYVMAEADLTDLLALRTRLNADLAIRISVNHLILLAVARVYQTFPDMNVVWRDGEIATLETVDVGLAVETPRGLFAPVIHDIAGLRLEALARAANDVASRAKDGTLQSGDLSGGAITVSNVGMFGASWLIPIINPGQSAILGVGATKREFRPDANDQPELRHIISLVLSADHRVHDGAKAARFLNQVSQLLENPIKLLI